MVQQNLFLLSGFSRHSLGLLSTGITASVTAKASPSIDAMCIAPQSGKLVKSRAVAPRRSSPSSLDNNNGPIESDSDRHSKNNGEGFSSEDKPGRSSTRIKLKWDLLDEERLRAWKKEGQSWKWIFRKFKRHYSACNTYALEHNTAQI